MNQNQSQVAHTEIELPATRDEVWDALTSDSGLAPWMGEGAAVDARPGGAISVPDVATGRPREGQIESLDRGRRLGFVWWPEDDPAERSHVSISLEPTQIGTRVVVIETLSASAAFGGEATAQAAWSWRQAMCAVSLRTLVH